MRKLLGVSIIAASMLPLMGGSASASAGCSRYAATSGSDSASGLESAPYRTVNQLVSSLEPGQKGCLMGGLYREDVTVRVRNITLTSAPGSTATIKGRFWDDADHTTVTRLNLNGANSDDLPSPSINADHDVFSYNNITDDHTAICFDIGSHEYGTATGTVITRNRIHDCGVMPAQNHDHGIYLQAAYHTQITWNEIYGNSDRGIQFYPDAQHTVVAHNIITGNGENIDFSGDNGTASSNNQVYDNIISNARIRADIQSWYPDGNPIGHNNKVFGNCLWGGAMGTVDPSDGGFTTYGNSVTNPQYVNRGTANFALRSSSPCWRHAGNVAAVVTGSESPQTAMVAPSKLVHEAREARTRHHRRHHRRHHSRRHHHARRNHHKKLHHS